MKLQQLGPNRTLVRFGDGTQVFFSYETPVAGYVPRMGYFKTEKNWSRTTSKQIAEYLRMATGDGGYDAIEVPQSWIESLPQLLDRQ